MDGLILYSRSDCHLCDEMVELLAAVAPRAAYRVVDIEPHLHLVYRYGSKVPVLRRTDNDTELCWPADAEMLSRFLSA